MTVRNLADTRPTKEYLVHGITQDVSIEECIFDLIDNAIDAYPRESSALISNYSDYTINLILQKDKFSIEDNGTGIEQNLLRKDTLRFGTKTNHHTTSIGYYGIGLNRAIFKLGRKINISTETNNERSTLSLDVSEFLKDNDNWSIPIGSQKLTGTIGTNIEINHLNSDVIDSFSNSEWLKNFCQQISMRYSEFIKKNLKIQVNKNEVSPLIVSIRNNSGFKPLTKEFNYNGIKVIIYLGQSSNHFFTYEENYNAEKNATRKECGWFVYCNDRAVKLFDWSPDTGWYTKFHSEHNGFIGKAFFIGNAGELPWNTSKTDVDLNKEVYKQALEVMKKFSEDWRKHTAKIKKGYRPAYEENPTLNNLFEPLSQQSLQLYDSSTAQNNLEPQVVPLTTQNNLEPQVVPLTAQNNLEPQVVPLTTQNNLEPQVVPLTAQNNLEPQVVPLTAQNNLEPQVVPLTTQNNLEPQVVPLTTQNNLEPQSEVLLPESSEGDEYYLYDPKYSAPSHISDYEYLFHNKSPKIPFLIPDEEVKLKSLLAELIKIKVSTLPLATLMLIRAFIELSCEYYSKKFHLDIKSKNPSLAAVVTRCLNKMEEKDHLSLDSRRISTLYALCNEKKFEKSVIAIQNLQITIHSKDLIWDKNSILTFWYAILPFITACYDHKTSQR